jgi:hypothetical protein
MNVSMPLVTIEELKKLSDGEIVERINGMIAPTVSTELLSFPLTDILGAQFYIDELDRREKRRADQERDEIEAKRWRTDLRCERWIVFLIILEVIVAALLTWWTDNRQSKSAEKELGALQGVQRVLSHLEENSKLTTGALDKLNEKLQSELDLTYEPSLNVEVDHSTGSLEIENKGKANIELWGERFNDRLNLEKHPIVITTGWPNRVSLPSGLMKGIAKGNLTGTVVLYLKTEAGKEYVAVCSLENQRAGEGFSIGVGKVQIKANNWSHDKKS